MSAKNKAPFKNYSSVFQKIQCVSIKCKFEVLALLYTLIIDRKEKVLAIFPRDNLDLGIQFSHVHKVLNKLEL